MPEKQNSKAHKAVASVTSKMQISEDPGTETRSNGQRSLEIPLYDESQESIGPSIYPDRPAES